MTYINLHPRQGLTAKHVEQAFSLGQGKCGEVDEVQDASLFSFVCALLCSKSLTSAGSNNPT